MNMSKPRGWSGESGKSRNGMTNDIVDIPSVA